MAGVNHVRISHRPVLNRPTGGNLNRGIRKPKGDGMAHDHRSENSEPRMVAAMIYTKSNRSGIVR